MKAIVKFLRDWSLPTSMVVGAMAYLLFAFTPALETAATALDPVFAAMLPLFMFLVLFVTFCKVDFHRLRPRRWHLWVSLFQMLFVLMDVGLILAFHLTGDKLILMEAVLTCIIGPGATAAAVVTMKLGGNLEQMTTYTLLSNILCAVMVPIVFPLIDKDVTMTFLEAFLLILYKVSLILMVPMLLAYIVKHTMHRLHQRIIGVRDLSFYLWCCSLTIVTGTTVKNIVHADTTAWFLMLIALLGLLVCIVQFAVGRYIGHFFHATIEAGQGLGQKNTAFSIWISYTYLSPLSSVGPGCYILWQNIINSLELWHQARQTNDNHLKA